MKVEEKEHSAKAPLNRLEVMLRALSDFMMEKGIFIFVLIVILPTTAWAIVELDAKISLWNLAGALIVVAAGWVAMKGRIIRVEEAQHETQKRLDEASSRSSENQTALLKIKTEIFERFIDQERLLYEKVDERIARLEKKIDRLIEKGNVR